MFSSKGLLSQLVSVPLEDQTDEGLNINLICYVKFSI